MAPGDGRVERLARYLSRTSAHYESSCFQQFLFYPNPDGSWELVVGAANEYHADLWRRVGRARLAAAWGLPEGSVPWALEPALIPTGYVDFVEQSGRDIPVLELPSELPSGWTVGKVKSELLCGNKIQMVKPNPARNADPSMVKSYIGMFERARQSAPA